MNATDYKNKHVLMVEKLAKNPEQILSSIDPIQCHLMHMGIGLLDEYFEFEIAKGRSDKENMLEELGDMLFYTEGLVKYFRDRIFEFSFKPLTVSETYQLLGRTIKRCCFYEQDLNIADLIQVYNNLVSWITYEASHLGLTIVDVQIHNMEKLAKRYPNFDYSDQRAKDRADKTYKVICINNATKEEDFIEGNLTKDLANSMAKTLNNKEPEQSIYHFKAV